MSSNEPKKRLKAAESRRALLDAGLALLQSHGVAPGLDRVTLKEAIEVSGVPRSTAYRLYEGGQGQLEEFRADLLADLDKNFLETESTALAITESLEASVSATESGDPLRMAVALRELLRVVSEVNIAVFEGNIQWRVYMSSLASIGTGVHSDPKTTQLFREAANDFGERYLGAFETICAQFGLRPRPGLTMRNFGAAAAAATEGVALRVAVDPSLASVKRSTGPNGDPQNWNMSGVAIEGLILTFFEADPNATASADLSSWLT